MPAQVRRERTHDAIAGARNRLRTFEIDHPLVDREIGHVRLDRRFTNALLTREGRKPNLVSVPCAPWRGRRVYGLWVGVRLSLSGGRAERRGSRRNQDPPAHTH